MQTRFSIEAGIDSDATLAETLTSIVQKAAQAYHDHMREPIALNLERRPREAARLVGVFVFERKIHFD